MLTSQACGCVSILPLDGFGDTIAFPSRACGCVGKLPAKRLGDQYVGIASLWLREQVASDEVWRHDCVTIASFWGSQPRPQYPSVDRPTHQQDCTVEPGGRLTPGAQPKNKQPIYTCARENTPEAYWPAMIRCISSEFLQQDPYCKQVRHSLDLCLVFYNSDV